MSQRTFTRILESELVFERGLPQCGHDGAFGRVVPARYKGGLVAVKSLLPSKKADQEQLASLEKEIAALAHLKHPNIVTLIGVCYCADGSIYIVEELAECDLCDFLQGVGGSGLAMDHVYKLGLDIARGVAFMHASGLGHHDLKPANVLMCKGTAVIADFGLVRKLNSAIGTATKQNGAVGTLPYMAPENMDSYDPLYLKATADVYSFGCILYELATGKCPWRDEIQAGWGTVQFVRAVNISKQRPALTGVPEPLRSLIERCWKDPAERPNAAALVQELTELYTRTSRKGDPTGAELAAMRRLVEVCRRHAIRPDYVRALRNLMAFDLVLICDDSGSMALDITQGDGKKTTRWQELKESVQVVTELAAAVDEDGCDVYFLNREPVKSVTDPAQATSRFANDPSGGTPLTAALTRALHDKGYRLSDGVPDEGSEAFVAALQKLPENCFVQLMAVTDDPAIVKWMNSADDKVRFVDVNDDYWSEYNEVTEKQGAGFQFTRGDYLAKVLLGAIDPFFDLMDETKLPEGMQPLPFPSFPPLPGKLHYRSGNSGGGGKPGGGAGGGMGGGGGGGGGK